MQLSVKGQKETVLEEKLKRNLLKELIYEYRNGQPIYYRNYREVLKGKLSKVDIMGSSSLHGLLVALLTAFLVKHLSEKGYIVLSGEVGYIPQKGTRYNLDIAVFERNKLQEESITNTYVKIPPKVVIEIDTKADTEKFGSFEAYMFAKTKDLLKFGTDLVIWFLTQEKKVLYARRNKDWIVYDWDKDLKLPEGVVLNLENLLKEYNLSL